MNHYNIKHKVTISTKDTVIGKNHKDGDIVDCEVKAELLEFFERNEDGYYTRVLLDREFIVDLYHQIQWIEKSTIEKPFKSTPF
jgi:hypothetical protein